MKTIHEQKQNKFWNETKKYQMFDTISCGVEESISNTKKPDIILKEPLKVSKIFGPSYVCAGDIFKCNTRKGIKYLKIRSNKDIKPTTMMNCIVLDHYERNGFHYFNETDLIIPSASHGSINSFLYTRTSIRKLT